MVSRALGGSCQVPLAAYAEAESGELRLRAWAGNVARARAVYAQASGSFDQAEALGRAVVEQMKSQGVEQLLAAGPEAG
jgi:hydroxymethylbilane synthase